MNRLPLFLTLVFALTALACRTSAGQGQATPMPTIAAPTPSTAATIQICVDALNIRAQPNPGAVILKTLFRGQVVQVRTEQAVRGGGQWAQIETGELSGWVNARYLCRK